MPFASLTVSTQGYDLNVLLVDAPPLWMLRKRTKYVYKFRNWHQLADNSIEWPFAITSHAATVNHAHHFGSQIAVRRLWWTLRCALHCITHGNIDSQNGATKIVVMMNLRWIWSIGLHAIMPLISTMELNIILTKTIVLIGTLRNLLFGNNCPTLHPLNSNNISFSDQFLF